MLDEEIKYRRESRRSSLLMGSLPQPYQKKGTGDRATLLSETNKVIMKGRRARSHSRLRKERATDKEKLHDSNIELKREGVNERSYGIRSENKKHDDKRKFSVEESARSAPKSLPDNYLVKLSNCHEVINILQANNREQNHLPFIQTYV